MATIKGTKYNDTLRGTDNADTISGLDGHDVLVASYGADIMDGGAGYDSVDYGYAYAGVAVNLATGHGYTDMAEGDTLVSIERLYGSVYNDAFIGNAEYNEFYGWYGNDYLDGGEYLDHLEGQGGSDYLKGGGGDDYLDGGTDDDTLIGGAGADALIGGIGIDTADYSASPTGISIDFKYGWVLYGDAAGDTFSGIENFTGSAFDDRISVDTTTNGSALRGNDGSDILGGSPGADVIYGDRGDDRMGGMSGNDTIYGGEGRDWLDGVDGADILIGGTGDDTYLVDNPGDVVIELSGEGIDDRVYSTIDYTLGPNLERLDLYWFGGPLRGTGNERGNTINGTSSDDILDGAGGGDLLFGDFGNDWFFVDNSFDAIKEYPGQGLLDRAFTNVSYTLTAGQEIERLTTTDHTGVAPLNLRGNEFANTIYGNAGSNALSGMAGSDTLVGLGGIDAFVFNTALDPTNNVDSIADYNVIDDDIILARGIFSALSPGSLPASQFHIGTGPADADDRIIYNSATGTLSYDLDGIGLAAAIPFATVSPGTALTNADFIVV